MSISKGVANHLHRYKRINIGTKSKPYWVYRCMKPACSHYIPVHLSEGVLCECNRCEEPLIIGKVQLNGSSGRAMTKPHCKVCIKKKAKDTQDVAAIANFLNEKTGS